MEGERRPWWQRAATWRVLLPLLVTLTAVTTGLLLQLVKPFHFSKTVTLSRCLDFNVRPITRKSHAGTASSAVKALQVPKMHNEYLEPQLAHDRRGLQRRRHYALASAQDTCDVHDMNVIGRRSLGFLP